MKARLLMKVVGTKIIEDRNAVVIYENIDIASIIAEINLRRNLEILWGLTMHQSESALTEIH